MEKKTRLYDVHVALGAQMVPFAGYTMPVQYPVGMMEEHRAVRSRAGLFDVSHMGEFFLSGPQALQDLQHILTNSFLKLEIGRVRYSPMCQEDGGCLDDLLVYRLAEDRFMLVVNASNREKDFQHIQKHISAETELADRSDETGLIALQGPLSRKILERLLPAEQIPEKYYSFVEKADFNGIPCLVSRTGYTGELGYELYHRAEDSEAIWNLLFSVAQEGELTPCGLGARDTLRLEAGMPLYGHEMDETTTPLEAGLDFGVKLTKSNFIGKTGIEAKLPLQRTRIGLRVLGRGIVREEMEVLHPETGEVIGMTTSGTFAPTLEYAIAMAMVPPQYSELGTKLQVLCRNRKVDVEVTAIPFLPAH